MRPSPEPPAGPPSGETPLTQSPPLAVRAAKSTLWSVLANAFQVAVIATSFLVVTPLLTPVDVGLVAMAATVAGLLMIVGDAGITIAVMRLPVIDQVAEATAFWTALAGGATLTLLSAAAAPLLGWFFQDQRVTALGLALATTFTLAAPGRVSSARLRRDLRFGAIALVTAVSGTLALTASWWLARHGAGPWAVVANATVAAASQAALYNIVCPIKPRPAAYSRRLARELATLGMHISGYNLSITFSRSLDAILGGRVLGAAPLGLLSTSLRLINTPVETLGGVFVSVYQPILIQMSAPERRTRALTTALRLAMLTTIPVSLGVFSVAREIEALLPPRWEGLAVILQLLAVGSLASPFVQLSTATLTIEGRGRTLLWLGIASLCLNWTGVGIAVVAGSIVLLAGAIAVCNFLMATAAMACVWRSSQLRPSLGLEAGRIFLSGLLMVAGVRLALHLFGTAGTTAGLVIGISAGAVCYGLCLITILRSGARLALELVGSTFPGRGHAKST